MIRASWFLFLCALAAACTEASAPTDSASQAVESKADLAIDQNALAQSIRFATRQRVQAAEVDEGCAAAPNGRALVRFDLKVQNLGPGDVDFGKIHCVSSDPGTGMLQSPLLRKPGVLLQGKEPLHRGGGQKSDFFTFSCAHRDVQFRAAARYELVNQSGQVVRKRQQGLLLRDRERAQDGADCQAKTRTVSGAIGLSSGCGSVQPGALGCQYVDATGLPPGGYTLRVKVDSLNAVAEQDEQNNAAEATVTVSADPAGPLERTRPVYLVCYGDGSLEEALEYYAALSPGGFEVGKYSLNDWIVQFMDGRPQVDALYRNANELGFWREMHCTKTIGRNDGGCWVRNWADMKTFNTGAPNLGTVAMRVDAEGRTQFFVFNGEGKLAPQAALDDEGPKSVPRLCVNCHGGTFRGGSETDLGSMFRQFEPDLQQRRPGVAEATAQAEFHAFNQAIKSANGAVRSQAEGAPFGVDEARTAMAAYMDKMYPSAAKKAIPVRDPKHVPPSWKDGFSARQRKLNEDLWVRLVNPYCMSCHRNNLINWENYELFTTLGPPFGSLRSLLSEDPDDPDRENQVFMPQSKLAWRSLVNDAEALIAMERWLASSESAPSLAGGGEPDPGAGGSFFHAPRPGLKNSPPIALAMHLSEVRARAVVTLDARKSFDPDGNRVAIEWQQILGPEVVLFGSSRDPEVRFVAPPAATPTSVGFLLSVRDSRGAVAEKFVEVAVAP